MDYYFMKDVCHETRDNEEKRKDEGNRKGGEVKIEISSKMDKSSTHISKSLRSRSLDLTNKRILEEKEVITRTYKNVYLWTCVIVVRLLRVWTSLRLEQWSWKENL